jgi:tetratricopeptide (TPR) repeat protein
VSRSHAILLLCFSSFLLFPVRGAGQAPYGDPTIPAEFLPDDPEIRTLLGFDNRSCKPSDPNWADKLQKALEIANTRGLMSDRAIVEAALASSQVVQGQTDQAFLLFQKALQDSIETKRQVLQADILVSLSSESQMKGNIPLAMDLVSQALALAERSGNLYGKSRALGELGKLKLQAGQTEEAAKVIDQALDIDVSA